MESLLFHLHANSSLDEGDLEFCFSGPICFNSEEKEAVVETVRSAFTDAHAKLKKYIVAGAQPGNQFLQEVRILDPRNLVNVDVDYQSINCIPGMTVVPKTEWHMYVSVIGTAAVKHSINGELDLALFWKLNAGELPSLYKIALCYCTSTLGSYEVERSFSAYNAIVDHNRRSLDPKTIREFHFLNWNLRAKSSIREESVPKTSGPTPKSSGPVPKPFSPVPKTSGPTPKSSIPVPKPFSPVPKTSGPTPKSSGPVPKTFSSSGTRKRKKKQDISLGKRFRTSLGSFSHGIKLRNPQSSCSSSPDISPARKTSPQVHSGLDEDTLEKVAKTEAHVFPGYKDALVNSIVDGSVKFKGSPLITLQDLQGLKGGQVKDEDNYLSNFVIDSYLKVLAETTVGDLKVETLEWETFEKGVNNRPVTDLLKGKANNGTGQFARVICKAIS
ncbi:hypothetical protein QZH41_001562 [Actinostola sp. cb2023]|nr:hypothetical protein QZH41_001562 [Actinostola sp. cb2023]